MLEDITTTIKAQLYERISSPLLSSFLISWALINYRFLLILLSSMPAHEKLIYIELNIFSSFTDYFMKGLVLPLSAALFLIFIYPYPAAIIYKISREHNRKLKEIQQRIDDETPLTREEARKIRKDAARIQIEHDAELERKNRDLETFKILNSKLLEEVEGTKPREKLMADSAQHLTGQLKIANEELDKVRIERDNLDRTLQQISNHPNLTRSGLYATQNIDTDTLLKNKTTPSLQLIPAPEDSIAEQAVSTIKEYIHDLKIFGDAKFSVREVNGKILTERDSADGKKIVHTWGNIDPINFHKSVHEIMHKLKLDRDFTIQQKISNPDT